MRLFTAFPLVTLANGEGASDNEPILTPEEISVLPDPIPVNDPLRHDYDDLFYPKSLLKKLAAEGVDVSGLQAITGTYGSKQAAWQQRGLTSQHSKWDERDPADNKIVVPYSFHANYPSDFKTAAIDTYNKMNSDLGCIKLKYVDDVGSTQHVNGIWIVFEDVSGGGCYSALGKAPGHRGKTGKSSITQLGAPSGWQIMAFGTQAGGSSCSGLDEGTLQHEMLHALGVEHEHSRPDRDNYLNVDYEATSKDSSFATFDNWLQVPDGNGGNKYPFEPNSVMHYCSTCAASGSDPVLTHKDGSHIAGGDFMTTTDSLQLIWMYCDADADKGNPKETVDCPSVDKVGYTRPVYVDRVCDGRFDCYGGEDEIDGSLANCIPESTLSSGNAAGCCASYLVGGVEFVYQENEEFNNHGTWANPNNPSEMILKWDSKEWLRSIVGNPNNNGGSVRFNAKSVNGASNGACPPVDLSWEKSGGGQYSVLCKSSGAQFNSANECQDGTAECDPVATCTDTVAGYTCKCPSTHSGDGKTCTEIVLVDECSNGSHTCPEICTDQQDGFTCSCRDGQFDTNGDGSECLDLEPCCETFRMGLFHSDFGLMSSYQAECTYERTNSLTGMMEYSCGKDPDYSTFKLPPLTIQYIPNIHPPAYILTPNALNPDGVSVGGIIYTTYSKYFPAAGVNCPSMESDDWSTLSSYSWSLECKTYFTPDPPADPCTDGSNNCHSSATCTKTNDGYDCDCKTGFTGDGFTCKALVNECETGHNFCDPNAFCTDTEEHYTCTCKDGFVGGGEMGSCKPLDVDECQAGTANCDPVAICTNTSPGYTCTCPSTHSGDGLTCTELEDECSNGKHDCPERCTDLQVGFLCSCQINQLDANGDGRTCYDTCLSNPCHSSAICTNNRETGYDCDCKPGFIGDGFICKALVNECQTGDNNCDPNAFCVDTADAYTCICEDGFDGDGFSCTQRDVDECQDRTHKCDTSVSTCVNNEGSYSCQCNAFTQQLDSLTCGDLDECAAGDPCNINNQPIAGTATCTNLINQGFTCGCDARPGFVEDTSASTFTCKDVDECETAGICDSGESSNSSCVNFEGDYYCKCDSGYEHTDDTAKICKDIDECHKGTHNCGNNICINTAGSFTCVFNVDPCQPNPCQNDGECREVNGEYRCYCVGGYAGHNCEISPDPCQPNPCLNGGECFNGITANDYKCTCADPENYSGDNCEKVSPQKQLDEMMDEVMDIIRLDEAMKKDKKLNKRFRKNIRIVKSKAIRKYLRWVEHRNPKKVCPPSWFPMDWYWQDHVKDTLTNGLAYSKDNPCEAIDHVFLSTEKWVKSFTKSCHGKQKHDERTIDKFNDERDRMFKFFANPVCESHKVKYGLSKPPTPIKGPDND